MAKACEYYIKLITVIVYYNAKFRCIKKLDRRIGNNAQARVLVDMYTIKKINEVSKIASNLIPHDDLSKLVSIILDRSMLPIFGSVLYFGDLIIRIQNN